MGINLEHKDFEFEIKVEKIEDLTRHEAISKKYLDGLVDEIKEDEFISNPIIADEESGIVLDGMHRYVAISKLGYSNIPVCFVDYSDPRISVKSWCRLIDNLDLDYLKIFLEEEGFQTENIGLSKMKEIISERELNIILKFSDDEIISIRGFEDLLQLFNTVDNLEKKAIQEGANVTYLSKDNLLKNLSNSKLGVLYPPSRKQDVITAAKSNNYFPTKITRHVLPLRPVGIKIKLELLDKEISVANKILRQNLEEIEIKKKNFDDKKQKSVKKEVISV